jgi:hypothetical protein
MSKAVPIDRGRAIRAALRKVHRAVVQDSAVRRDALKLLEMYLEPRDSKSAAWRLRNQR